MCYFEALSVTLKCKAQCLAESGLHEVISTVGNAKSQQVTVIMNAFVAPSTRLVTFVACHPIADIFLLSPGLIVTVFAVSGV